MILRSKYFFIVVFILSFYNSIFSQKVVDNRCFGFEVSAGGGATFPGYYFPSQTIKPAIAPFMGINAGVFKPITNKFTLGLLVGIRPIIYAQEMNFNKENWVDTFHLVGLPADYSAAPVVLSLSSKIYFEYNYFSNKLWRFDIRPYLLLEFPIGDASYVSYTSITSNAVTGDTYLNAESFIYSQQINRVLPGAGLEVGFKKHSKNVPNQYWRFAFETHFSFISSSKMRVNEPLGKNMFNGTFNLYENWIAIKIGFHWQGESKKTETNIPN